MLKLTEIKLEIRELTMQMKNRGRKTLRQD
jgi:hypothetical protein